MSGHEFKLLSVAELLALPRPEPTTVWGPWRLIEEPSNGQWFLTYMNGTRDEYNIDLERCTTRNDVCDWLAHIGSKTWGTPEVLGHLVHGLHAVLNLYSSHAEPFDLSACLKRFVRH